MLGGLIIAMAISALIILFWRFIADGACWRAKMEQDRKDALANQIKAKRGRYPRWGGAAR